MQLRRMLPFLLFAAASSSASAQDLKGVWFAGGTLSEDSSGYAGVVAALPGGALGRGFAVRGAVNAGAYRYFGAPGEVDAHWQGGELALVHQWSGPWGWANISGSALIKHTKLDPDDPGNDRGGTHPDFSLQLDGARLSGPWRFSWIGSYAFDAEEYQGRLSLARNVSQSGLRIGVEGGLQGDPNYRRASVGLLAGKAFAGGLDVVVAAGATRLRGDDTSAYGSLSLSRTF